MKRRFTGPLTVLVFLFMNTPAAAYTVKVGGEIFDVTTITGSFDALQDLLDDQVWWGNNPLAAEFAGAVNTGLGMPNFFNGVSFGPVFAWACSDSCSVVHGRRWPSPGFEFGAFTSTEVTFAIATAVPEPGTLGLALIGLAGLGLGRKRKQRQAAAV